MTWLPIAHAGHILADLLYLVPLMIVVGMLRVASVRDKRAEAEEAAAAEAGGGGGEEASESHADAPADAHPAP